jgi:hypothetical protein
MLRPGKFSEPERWLIWLIASALFAAGATGIGLAIARSQEKLGLAGIGVLALAVAYLIAAFRGRPL